MNHFNHTDDLFSNPNDESQTAVDCQFNSRAMNAHNSAVSVTLIEEQFNEIGTKTIAEFNADPVR
jgi:hypothetical protein